MYKISKSNKLFAALLFILTARSGFSYGFTSGEFLFNLFLVLAYTLLSIEKKKPKEIKEVPKCEDGYSPKYFIIEKHGVLKAYKADGLRIGEFMGYATWDDKLGEFRISKT